MIKTWSREVRSFSFRSGIAFALFGAHAHLLLGCPSSSTEVAPVPSASSEARAPDAVAPAWDPPPREGCARTGPLDGVETDPSCVVAHADESLTRESMKDIAIDLQPDAPVTVGGATVLVRLTIANRGANEANLVFVAQPSSTKEKPDWTRLAGVPELRPGAPDAFRILMPVRTLDGRDRTVDGLPTTQQSATPSSRLLLVRLKPGGKLTHAYPWWALRILPPMPIYYDDAGHRFVPKTAPTPLPPGEYGVAVDLPLYGVSPAESAVTTKITVEKLDKPDGSAPSPPVPADPRH